MKRRWAITSEVLQSDCGNFTLVTKEERDADSWSWKVIDLQGEIVDFGTSRAGKPRLGARACALRSLFRIRQRTRLVPHHQRVPHELREQLDALIDSATTRTRESA